MTLPLLTPPQISVCAPSPNFRLACLAPVVLAGSPPSHPNCVRDWGGPHLVPSPGESLPPRQPAASAWLQVPKNRGQLEAVCCFTSAFLTVSRLASSPGPPPCRW